MSRVLLVADDNDLGGLVTRALSRDNHVVEIARTGEEAIVRCGHRLPDVLVIDLDLRGFHLLASVLRAWPGLPVCTLGDPRWTPLGPGPHVPKPFTHAGLRAEVLAAADTGRIPD